MHKLLTLFLTVSILGVTNAQTALIKDSDGYCNIRQRANSHAKVLDTLPNDKIVFVFSNATEGDWLPVDYYKGNKRQSNQSLSGYVHKSRIIFLSDLPKFRTISINDSLLNLQLDTIQITITKRKFLGKSRQIKYDKPQGEQKFVKYIDGKYPWGTDGDIPRNEYKNIQVKSGQITLTFPKTSFKDIFEPNFDMTAAYIDKATGKLYIEAMNSDGAGGYVVIWTIKDGQIISRETFIPF